MYGLIDCNNFFVSCERIFNPSLLNRPVIVLSNNDGCVISRSDEAKKLDIKMGVPFYQIKSLCCNFDVAIFSCNFEFYGNISNRLMRILRTLSYQVEKYSIDEAFIDLSHIDEDKLHTYAKLIKKRIERFIGIPVSVGIAKTKTLAKVAVTMAKENSGTYVLVDESNLRAAMDKTAAEDIWGFSRKTAIKLKLMGVSNASQFINISSLRVKKVLTVTGLRTQLELKGISCNDLKDDIKNKKQIISSRSFGKLISSLDLLQEAISSHVINACEKLRNQDSLASSISVFIATNKHRVSDQQYRKVITVKLPSATHLTNVLIKQAKILLEQIYKPGLRYYKAGIALAGIINNKDMPLSMIEEGDSLRQQNVMAAIDTINARYKKNILYWAARGTKQEWQMKREMKSPNYTGRWDEIPIART